MSRALHIETFDGFQSAVPRALDALGAAKVFSAQPLVILKPNLVNESPPPVTTPVAMCEAIVRYIKKHSEARVVIAEGCGSPEVTTYALFKLHGYEELARREGVELLDLNEAPTRLLKNSKCSIFPEMHLPDILFQGFLVSCPVLKAHSLAKATLSMKNMMGCAPPAHYQRGGYWRKASFHAQMQEAIFELNRYRSPDLSLIDASIGMAEHHLGGAECAPPANKIIAGFDPVAVDAAGAKLLGLDYRSIGHIQMANGLLGKVEN